MLFVNILQRKDLFEFICELVYQEWKTYYNKININSSDELIVMFENDYINKSNKNNKLNKFNNIFLLFDKINSINQLVGFVTISEDDLQGYKKIEKNSLFINEIYILKNYRKLGYGKKLIKYGIEYIKNLNFKTYISVQKKELLGYYRKLGFIEVDNYNLDNQEYIIMEYLLD